MVCNTDHSIHLLPSSYTYTSYVGNAIQVAKKITFFDTNRHFFRTNS
ncbi:hypothetical protein PBN151_5936 [Paenibacillus sp. NAIST15-1]|nr:hypothetical protein PBN151_5936 [Paenibacillus sp. NAIST15-1]